jgi:hypothetical protein
MSLLDPPLNCHDPRCCFRLLFRGRKGLLLHRRRGGKGLGDNISQERLGERVLRNE